MNLLRFLRSRDGLAALIALLVALGGVAAIRLQPLDSDQDEATADFKDSMESDGRFVDAMIADTKAGKNLSDFRLGMFSMNLLNQLSDRDPALGAYFHRGGRMMESYLTDVFQYHSEDEVARIAAMASSGDRPVRKGARDTLEALRHIPVDTDPPADQAQDRADLAKSLRDLKASLAEAARE